MSGLNRNDRCPCGSGKKYKKCCQGKTFDAVRSEDQALAVAFEHHQSGRLAEALDIYKGILHENPRQPDALHLAGVIALQTGQSDLAIDLIGQAIDVKPYFLYYCNLGNAFKAQGQVDQAKECYGQALALKSDHAESHYNLGVVLQAQGELDRAIESYRLAVSANPDYAEALGNLGAALQIQGRADEAAECYQKVLSISDTGTDSLAGVCNNLSMMLKDHHRYAEALTYAQRAVALKPSSASACQSLAALLAHLSDYTGVCAASDAALALDPEDSALRESRLYCYSYHPDLSAQDIYGEFVRWGDRFPARAWHDFAGHERTPARRLRIGYVSPDFRRHTSRFFFEPLFAHHDKAQFELFAYSNVLEVREDDYTARFRSIFDHWRDIRGVSDDDAAALVRRDQIDILVDCCNHMQDDRLGVFVRKPAPLQVTWLGAAWTTGLANVDYVLFDRYMAPPGTLTREKIVQLPGCFVAYRPPQETAEVVALPALKNGYITFGYSGRTERLNHRVFDAWGEILRRLPDARLILDYAPFADPPTQAYYRDFLTRHGVDVSRVTMRRSTNIFKGLCDIDILLDCFPHSGGTMLFDALWMGVPALTLAGRPPVGRIGTSLMMNLGLSEWVTHSEDEYVGQAVALARDTAKLAEVRVGMRERMRRSPLMDEPGFARGVESALRAMWQTWCEEAQ